MELLFGGRIRYVKLLIVFGIYKFRQHPQENPGTVDLFIITYALPTLFSSQLLCQLFMPKKATAPNPHPTSIAPRAPLCPVSGVEVHPESGHRGVSTEKKVGREYLLATEYSGRPIERPTARAIKDCTLGTLRQRDQPRGRPRHGTGGA